MRWLTGIALLAFSWHAVGASVSTFVPDDVDVSRDYILYLHGAIIEDRGPSPVDSRFGAYDYAGILDALSSRGATVISQVREHDTDVNEYAGKVIAQITQLLEAGVPQDQIAVVGFSKGGDIAVHVSSFARLEHIRYVLLAACWPKPKEPQLRLTGKVLSVYEASDTLAGFSCRPLTEHGDKPSAFEEIEIHTGQSHGAFYRPREEWVTPVLDYLYPPTHR